VLERGIGLSTLNGGNHDMAAETTDADGNEELTSSIGKIGMYV